MRRLFIFPIKLYRRFISPLKPPSCRFTPTCSQYAIEALEKRGVVVGIVLIASRIVRCNPFCKGGHDPVPEKLLKRRSKNSPDDKSNDDDNHTGES